MLCKKLYRRNDNPHVCQATRNDYVLYAVATRAKEEEAARALETFMSNAERNLCIEKRTYGCEINRPFELKPLEVPDLT